MRAFYPLAVCALALISVACDLPFIGGEGIEIKNLNVERDVTVEDCADDDPDSTTCGGYTLCDELTFTFVIVNHDAREVDRFNDATLVIDGESISLDDFCLEDPVRGGGETDVLTLVLPRGFQDGDEGCDAIDPVRLVIDTTDVNQCEALPGTLVTVDAIGDASNIELTITGLFDDGEAFESSASPSVN